MKKTGLFFKLLFLSLALSLGLSFLFGCGQKDLDTEIPNKDDIEIFSQEDCLLPPCQEVLKETEESEDNSDKEISINDLNEETPSSSENEIIDTKKEEIPQQIVETPQNKQPVIEKQEEPQKEEPKKEEIPPEKVEEPTVPAQNQSQPISEKRAVWVSYLDFISLLKGKSEAVFSSNIQNAFNKVKALGLNTVIVQVRPFGDALYESRVFPWSEYASGEEGVSPGFDPLEIMVNTARKEGLKIEAWINPYRVRSKGSFSELSKGNKARAWQGTDDVVSFNGGIYFNPASESARELIVSGVSEIVSNYDVDGIHFDDYFYPTTSEDFDRSSYQNSGTSLSLGDWRRENVNKLVRSVYSEIKSINPACEFGISPQSSIEKNYSVQYVDARKWLSNSGYVDYIMPQIYHGFENSKMPFAKTVNDWNNLIKTNVRLEVGLSPYKIGLEDKYAGDGRYEWIESDEILRRMVLCSRKQGSYNGFALFRYDSIINPQASIKPQLNNELLALKEIF